MLCACQQVFTDWRIEMKEKGLLLVISGFSGAGKGTVVKSFIMIMLYLSQRQPAHQEKVNRMEESISLNQQKNLRV